MSYEIWTAHLYGAQFGQPESNLQVDLSGQQVAEWLRLGHGKLLHNLLVVDGEDMTRANKWLARFEKENK